MGSVIFLLHSFRVFSLDWAGLWISGHYSAQVVAWLQLVISPPWSARCNRVNWWRYFPPGPGLSVNIFCSRNNFPGQMPVRTGRAQGWSQETVCKTRLKKCCFLKRPSHRTVTPTVLSLCAQLSLAGYRPSQVPARVRLSLDARPAVSRRVTPGQLRAGGPDISK